MIQQCPDREHLLLLLMNFSQITKEEVFAEMSRDILLYISRDLSDEVCNEYNYIYTHTCVYKCIWPQTN